MFLYNHIFLFFKSNSAGVRGFSQNYIFLQTIIKMFNFKIQKLSLLFLSVFIFCSVSQTPRFQIFPLGNFVETEVSPRACYANCQFCQVSTGQCQQCYSPFFTKDLNGQCIFNTNYTLQSSRNQLRSGNSFIPSTSWSQRNTIQCTNTPSLNINGLGPFSSQIINYRRTISSHKYFTIKFLLLKVNWRTNSSLNIVVTDNEKGTILFQTNISQTLNVKLQSICSNTPLDQRFSLKIQFQNTDTNEINIRFEGIMDIGSTWVISTISVITGRCHPNCEDCKFSPDPDKCQTCKNFFTLGADGSCTNCSQGFQLLTIQNTPTCRKCSIQFQRCGPSNILCFYRNSQIALNNVSCEIPQPNNYASQKLVNELTFLGSLFTVDGRFAAQNCGQYSFVGLGIRRSTITRIFANLIGHIGLSVSFNIIVVDQVQNTDRQPFAVIVDNVLVDTYTITLNANSNVCGNTTLLQVFATFPPTRFIPHTSSTNVNISITSNSTNWGIRDLRIVFQKCDELCDECTDQNGCNTCKNLFQIKDSTCQGCTSGFIFTSNTSNSSCLRCLDANCVRCSLRASTCEQCVIGFYTFQGRCQKNPQFGDPVIGDSQGWEGQLITPTTGRQCFIEGEKFLVFQDKVRRKFTIPSTLLKTKVEFRLIKIDNWSPSNFLDVYINDLRVIHRNFRNNGNKICFVNAQNDEIFFEQIQVDDNNGSITVEFEVVKNQTQRRKFGIVDFKVIPFGCQKCSNFGFQYKTTYSIDFAINVQVIFNRIYRTTFQQFKQIFRLMNGRTEIPYQIIRSDNIRYILQAKPSVEIIKSNLRVICLYPERVTTRIDDQINNNIFFRKLQQSSPGQTKFLDNTQSIFPILRYTPLQQRLQSANRLRDFFNVITRIVIYIGFASFFFGCQTPFTHLMHNFQKIWLHIYVGSLSLHPLLLLALSGFRQVQNQNITIDPQGWERPLPNELYFEAPAQYQFFFKDIAFFRNIYNIAFAFVILLVFYIVIRLIILYWKMPAQIKDTKFIKHMKITFEKRPYFYFNSIIYYQYVTLTVACCLQFLDLTNRTNSGNFSGINSAACVIAFFLATIYPIVHYLYIRYKWNQMFSQGNQVKFVNRYSQIFYRFLPSKLWKPNDQNSHLSSYHWIYNVFRFGEIWWTAIIVTLMNGSPFSQAFLLMITNFAHVLLVLFTDLNSTAVFRVFKVIQLLFFAGIQIIILVLISQLTTLTEDSYISLAIVAIVFIFVIITISIIRTIYTFVKIYKQYDDIVQNRINTDGRKRNSAYYDSLSRVVEQN